jgi:hypothetical protein
MTDKEMIEHLRSALNLVQIALAQHSAGPAVGATRIAANGPTISEVISKTLRDSLVASRMQG